MGAPKASYIKRARMSAGAGPYLFLAGLVLLGLGLILGALYWPIMAAMALVAPALQLPRQKAWLTQNDLLEFASLVAMPIILAVLAWFWLRPEDHLSVSVLLQGLGGFFLALGVFHIVMKRHTLALADVIEKQD